jgi:uncharacterized protein YxeA
MKSVITIFVIFLLCAAGTYLSDRRNHRNFDDFMRKQRLFNEIEENSQRETWERYQKLLRDYEHQIEIAAEKAGHSKA